MWKGFQIATRIDANTEVPLPVVQDSIREAVNLGANCVRYQMVAPDPRWLGEVPYELDFRYWPLEKYVEWWKQQIHNIHVCAAMILSERLPIKIIVDCHSAYGGVLHGEDGSGASQAFLLDDHCRRWWQKLWIEEGVDALNMSGVIDAIAGYGLCNEPAAHKQRHWVAAAKRLTKMIRNRERDVSFPSRWIYVSTQGGVAHRFDRLRPIRGKMLATEAHVYCSADEAKMRLCVRRKLKAARDYCKKHGKPILLGEIGSSRFQNSEGAVAEFFGSILPMIERSKCMGASGGGGIVHSLNESAQWDYRTSPAINAIKEWMR